MKSDLYTKSVLTVIAVSLIALFIQNFNLIPRAKASGANQKNYGLVPLNPDGSINVMLSEPVDVNIVSIDGHEIHGYNLPISIDECNISVRVSQ